MNRLILIGNGFDLAHGLKTDYNSFIVWYLKNCFENAIQNREYHDELIEIHTKFSTQTLPHPYQNISTLIDSFYKSNLSDLQNDRFKFKEYSQEYMNPFFVKFKPKLGKTLLENCNYQNWVDIENEFYDELKDSFHSYGDPELLKIEQINNSLKFIIEQLEIYLSTISCENYNPAYVGILNSLISKADILKCDLKINDGPIDSQILNFNYTSTIEGYFKRNSTLPKVSSSVKINYIHGQINNNENPLIFGFGDELDENYKKMELSKANGFFEYIKSFWYFKTSNYHNLIRFIENDEYQIYILGHSCGLSDRTMLNMIFEHPNCKSIKIYYHGNKEKNNYTTLTQEISRHFKDKVAMRNKIVPFDRSEPMPQVE